ncbi:MAG: ribosome biogenesis GTPase Der [Dehalococcoidia bacterium]
MSIVAIVGRPNVGKSTLFNRLVGRRMAIVSEVAGTTRDRVSASLGYRDRDFILVDTGGLAPGPSTDLEQGVLDQIHIAIEEATVIIVMVDARDGLTAADLEVSDLLRRSGKPIVLAVNKVDNEKREADLPDFYRLGIGDPIPISAYHNIGLDQLMNRVADHLPPSPPQDQHEAMKIAIVGRPNVGKSMLLNAILGQDRVIVSESPGTTRDAVDTHFQYEGKPLLLIDTAGVRRRGHIEQGIERYSVLRTMQAIYRADVVLLIVDATELMTAQDLHIWGYTKDAFKGVVVVVNKWDLASDLDLTKKSTTPQLRARLRAAQYVPILYVSAKDRQGIDKLIPTAQEIFEDRGKKVATSALNRVLIRAVASSPAPSTRGRKIKVFYATQTDVHPPTFTLFVNDPSLMHFSYQRYLENQLREAFGFRGTPLQLRFERRSGER